MKQAGWPTPHARFCRGLARSGCVVPLLAILGACASLQPSACPMPGQIRTQSLRLYFGRAIPGGGAVSDADWAGFAAIFLTRAFPDGFSVTAAQGQWRAPDGSISHEPSLIVEHDGPADAGAVAALMQAYKTRFRQNAVGIVTVPVCAAF